MATERDTPEHRKRRRAFCALVTRLEPERFVFIDESYCQAGMRRDYGWARRGKRLFSSRPFRRWQPLSLIGAIRLGERPRVMTHRGAVNARVFLRFVRRRLVPSLRRGDVVVMDNLNIHRSRAVREAIWDAGAIPLHLPTYSPELNPIELLWADIKRRLRALSLDTREELAPVINRLRASTPIANISGWFRYSLERAQLK